MVRATLAVAGAVCAGVSMLLDGGVPRSEPAWGGVGVGLVVLAALCVLCGARVFAVALAVVGVGYAWYVVEGDLGSGVAGPSSSVLLVGALAVAVGAVVPRLVPRPWAVVGLVLVAGAALGAREVPRAVAVDAVTVGTRVAAPVVDRPTGAQWRWTAAAPVREAVVAGAGLVVGTDGGQVVAVTAGGVETWHYTRANARLSSLTATPDKGLVVAAFAGPDRAGDLWVLLDAGTGAVIREWAGPEGGRSGWVHNSTVFAEPDGDWPDFRVRATNLRSGAPLWTWQAPPGCRSPFGPVGAADGIVLVSQACGDSWALVALDNRDGKQRWSDQFTVAPGEGATYAVGTTTDGNALFFVASGYRKELLRAGDGAPVAKDAIADRWVWPDAGPVPVADREDGGKILSTVTIEDLAVIPVDGPCDRRRAVATTRTTVLRVCDTPTGADLIWQAADGSGQVPLRNWTPPQAPPPSGAYRSVFKSVGVFPAPGFIAVVSRGDPAVIGFP
ncbi:PQQ-binding-like beta-propeller repeat protein [Actinokineospora auranticolor]|uniref:Outer membrane protein assembly factor BamB n=1 Tax=Actinokineospora auranticolor TaxID=155976 RepID=A0A2S6GTJ7_9PSEU|nr:PQQ-binding-like beta-propeller repeat protein [Actinokineospora auranticolor]PPK68578.1 outer membrane protein assembly factor BamB [Actinokineospora auranticolor]